MSELTLDAIVNGLVSAGVPRARAEARARAECGLSDGRTVADREASDARAEKAIVAQADKQLRALGFRVINTSQPRHAKYLTPGIPDRIYFHRARRVVVLWEAKSATGMQSPAQRDFELDCEACGWPYVLGSDRVLYDWLIAQGIAAEEDGLLVSLSFLTTTTRG